MSYGKKYLLEHEIPTPLLDSQILLMLVTGKTKVDLLTYPDFILTDDDFSYFLSLLEKRASNMPVKYITGFCEFMGLNFKVNQSVLIPRPDTEILVEAALNILGETDNVIIDMCCGSGCISISIAHYLKNIRVIAVDISNEALIVAKENALLNNVQNNITYINSNLFESINNRVIVDAIISNPPYISDAQIDSLMDDVKYYEPLTALCGGMDGLDFYRAISFCAKNYLRENGYLLFEIGYGQYEAVKQILIDNDYKNINVIKDLASYNRVITAQVNRNEAEKCLTD